MNLSFFKKKTSPVSSKTASKKWKNFSFGHEPYGDWSLILLLGIVINLLNFVLAGYLFFEINQGTLFSSVSVADTSSPTSTMSHQADLKKVISFFDHKADLFQRAQAGNGPTSIDPSVSR
ncbi:MAG: hypothetical protein PHF79_02815 [Candidatus Pacebacteria bacterium]|nr:hypothetical protein [Candidatus Paceibacterota bacterium]